MKMAKANETDMEMALKLCSTLNALGRGDLPAFVGDDDPGLFDEYDDEQAAMAMRQLLNLVGSGSLERVIWGMHILIDPANKLIDPDADTLERHPEDIEAAKDAERYRWLTKQMFRNDTGYLDIGGEIQCNWNDPNEGEISRAIDAAMSSNAIVTGAREDAGSE